MGSWGLRTIHQLSQFLLRTVLQSTTLPKTFPRPLLMGSNLPCYMFSLPLLFLSQIHSQINLLHIQSYFCDFPRRSKLTQAMPGAGLRIQAVRWDLCTDRPVGRGSALLNGISLQVVMI